MPLTFLLQGGFGNQLLQVCAAFYAEKKLKQKINFDSTLLTLIPKKIRLRELEVQFAIKDYKLSKFNLFNLINYLYNQKEKCLVEKDLNDLILERISKQTKLISGYFHNIDYVDESFESLSEYLNIKMNQKKSLIDVQDNYVAIHFRAGDYVLDLHTRKSHGLSSLTY